MFFRKLQRTQIHARDTLGIYQIWLEHLYSYFEKYVQFPRFEELWVINSGDPLEPLSQEEIEMYATRARDALGIGLGPISNVMLLLEKKGLVIGRAPRIDSDIDACSRRKGVKGFVLLGLNKSAVRHRFDLAHEFGHLVLHHRITADDVAANPLLQKRLESEANSFAGAFLIPRDSFLRDFIVPTVDTLLRMKSHWKVSLAAIAQRAHGLQLFSDGFMEKFEMQRSMRGWRLNEPLDDEIPSEAPSMLTKAVQLLIKQDVVSRVDLLRAIALPQEDIYCLIGIDENFFGKQEEPVKLQMIKGGRDDA
ncbi:MAG: ImmA/IrrE family metallo-endopeptidase [Firmicutes bacterium]|nr:ImmA/IrrE family metallo-endopeptidase [Bacillota bacterium]